MKIYFILLLGIAAVSADKIVGGSDANTAIPYQVRIQYSSGSIRCGGTLIHKNWVLSAAHCQGNEADWRTWKLALGHYDGTNEDVQIFEVADQTPHPSYNSATIDNDVMILKISGSATITSHVQIGKLPEPYSGTDLPAFNSACVISGWGTTESGGSVSPYLKQATVYVVSNEECNKRLSYGGAITDGMLCLADTVEVEDACQGDSGGPAKCGDTIDGVVSWGIGCARPNFPGVYARVAYFRDWITEATNKDV